MARLYLIRHGKPAAVWGGGDDDPVPDDELAVAQRGDEQPLGQISRRAEHEGTDGGVPDEDVRDEVIRAVVGIRMPCSRSR